jgi:uncharacterized Zn finger protein
LGIDGCKHAVAVVLAYLEALADKKDLPVASGDDPRWAKLSAESTDVDDEFGEELEDEWDGDPDVDTDDEPEDESTDQTEGHEEINERPNRGGRVPWLAKRADHQTVQKKDAKRRTRADWDEKIRSHIQEKSREELAELVRTLVGRFPELRAEFQERIALTEGDVDRLVNQTRRELHALTAEVGWRNHWDDQGHTPDYSKLKHRLERLAEQGHGEEVVELGSELIRRGIAQIEQSHDEGETAIEISGCLQVVFDALSQSSRPASDKILYAIDADLQDEYDVIGNAANVVLNAKWTHADWSSAADRLAGRLKKSTHGKNADEFSRNYRRNRLSNWLLHALDRAGRSDELLAVYEAEARATGSYERLVRHLIGQNQFEDAERWAREGIERTQEKWPGIASSLLKTLCELACRRKDWGVVAAHAARDFFERPSMRGFQDLIAAASKAKCAQKVRAAGLQFLESGLLPIGLSASPMGKKDASVDPTWPLPVPDYLVPSSDSGSGARGARSAQSARPHYDVLLEMAMAERKPDEVLHWYDKLVSDVRRLAGSGWRAHEHPSYSDQVAAAVTSAHPQRALDIYHRGLDDHLKHADISAYERCADYLRKMRPILKLLGREEEWTRLLAVIRQSFRNRPRFMEILDTLEGRTILQTTRSRRAR